MESEQTVASIVDRLADMPVRIARATANASPKAVDETLAPDEWSATEILAHLRASDDILSHRLYAMLARDNPPLSAYDERRWAEIAGYSQIDFTTSLQLFTLRRAELITMVRRLAPDDWQRIGTHEVHGVISLLYVVRVLVEHEEEHCAQLETLAR
jgi:hypothetical protein